jgi:hypothetical protein
MGCVVLKRSITADEIGAQLNYFRFWTESSELHRPGAWGSNWGQFKKGKFMYVKVSAESFARS